ncbi:hypothetical protein CEXT_197211 [Caerostris extrusa]|uniref:Uncharacterized protein n=1 Tax=Caerostris extrusa TaxID=172846 RepID=A0AAV4MCX9_CAEEX|nr:hypothetical protein CEXT_197211 [Caerostris extrusa]
MLIIWRYHYSFNKRSSNCCYLRRHGANGMSLSTTYSDCLTSEPDQEVAASEHYRVARPPSSPSRGSVSLPPPYHYLPRVGRSFHTLGKQIKSIPGGP